MGSQTTSGDFGTSATLKERSVINPKITLKPGGSDEGWVSRHRNTHTRTSNLHRSQLVKILFHL